MSTLNGLLEELRAHYSAVVSKRLNELLRDGYRGPFYAWVTIHGIGEATRGQVHTSVAAPPPEPGIRRSRVMRFDIDEESAAAWLARGERQ
jgi:hypothetical protein